MKHNDILIDYDIEKGESIVFDLGEFLPLGKIILSKGLNIKNLNISLSIDGKKFNQIQINDSFNDDTSRFIKISSNKNGNIKILLGLGYRVSKNDELTSKFEQTHNWVGADGIYSFNLDKEENYDQKESNLMFVFGDTFYGEVSNLRRIEPHAFLNNSLGYFKDNNLEFHVNKDKLGNATSLFEPDINIRKRGYIASNLVKYHGEIDYKGYISSNNKDQDVLLIFDLNNIHYIKNIKIENFHEEPTFDLDYSLRGVRHVKLFGSNDKINYEYINEYSLSLYSKDNEYNDLLINKSYRYIKLLFEKELNNSIPKLNNTDYTIGLKKIYFYNENNDQYFDINVETNSEFFFKEAQSWFWLQDGIRINNDIYFYPCLIEDDLTQVEGYQFKVSGVAQIKGQIKDSKFDYKNIVMKEAPLYRIHNNNEYIFPSAILNNTKIDGYIYFYGYKYDRTNFLRSLIVGRIKENKIEDLNELEFYLGDEKWSKDFINAKTILDHVSCEMSVERIIEGENKDKYIAVFEYDTNGPFVAYAIGEKPYDLFTKARIIYHTPEVDDFYETTYTYNAKMHISLSSPRNLVVSYNSNDMSMDNNKKDFRLYHPRFLNLIDTSNDD